MIHVKMSEKDEVYGREIDPAVSYKAPDGSRSQVNDNDLPAYSDKVARCGPLVLGKGST